MTIDEELAELSAKVPKLEADLAAATALNVSLQADLDKAKADFAAQEAADPAMPPATPPTAVDLVALRKALDATIVDLTAAHSLLPA